MTAGGTSAATSCPGRQTTTTAPTDTTGGASGGGSPIDPREPLKERKEHPHRVRRFHSAGRTKHRVPGGDTSITQYAMIDDDNVSQQVTRGGGGGEHHNICLFPIEPINQIGVNV